MPPIRIMLGLDTDALADAFPEKPEGQFEAYYLDQLQDRRTVLIAVEVFEPEDEAAEREVCYYGYVTIVWEAPYTQFWRRNIPEIVDLYVAEAYRGQGIGSALIEACEEVVRGRDYRTIGISVEQSADYAAANRLYPKLGYVADGFGITAHDNELHLVKEL